MPTYDYRCDACGHALEIFHSISEKPKKKCPACGKQKLVRLIGAGAGFLFKGSGFYLTDYRSESYKAAEKSEKQDASPVAESAKPAESQAAEAKPAESKASETASAERKSMLPEPRSGAASRKSMLKSTPPEPRSGAASRKSTPPEPRSGAASKSAKKRKS